MLNNISKRTNNNTTSDVYVLMKFDTLDTSYILSSVGLFIDQIVSKNVPYL